MQHDFWRSLAPVWISCLALGNLWGAGSLSPGVSGQVLESKAFDSRLLGREVKYSIYLPPDYAPSSRRYPVVYLLHGFTDDETAWIQYGEVNRAADEGLSTGAIPPMIIVMPDGGVTWYINDSSSRTPYEDMFVEEFIPHIDTNYRTRPEKEFRGVSGLSMGGYGSLGMAMRHPDLFAACAAFSSGLWTDKEIVDMKDDRYGQLYSSLFGENLRGEARLNSYWRNHSPIYLAETLPVATLKEVRWYVDCGDDDFLYKGNSALHVILRSRGVPHEYRVRDGAHQWLYWRTGILDGLRFIGESFNR